MADRLCDTILNMEIEETQKFAGDFLQRVIVEKKGAEEAKTKATIVGLFGDLGAGKTTFSKAVAAELGIVETVSSPTFVIEKVYKITSAAALSAGFTHFIHIDAYRLESGSELLHLGFKEMADDSKNLIFIEWPEKVVDILEEGMIKLHFKVIDEKRREITTENF